MSVRKSDKPIAKYQPHFYLNEYGNVSYDWVRRGIPNHSAIPQFQMNDLKKQGISKRDLLSGRVELWEYPRADITGQRTSRGFRMHKFVKVR